MNVVDTISLKHNKTIGIWLLSLCTMVFVMVVLGGVTRLTHSGLSMVNWKPVTGWLPPMSETEWQTVFQSYRQFPEYKELNEAMTLSGFKGIFWLEFFHRLWGRLIGVVFLVPLLVFLFKGWVDRKLAPRLVVMFILGGLQGVLGWYMVKSGLVGRPDVSQYRLAAHLGAALIIYGYMLWVALGLLSPKPAVTSVTGATGGAGVFAALLVVWVFFTILSGGFVAGLDAGFSYNTFPLMDGELIPAGIFDMKPFHINFFENITTVQFDHRLLAETLFLGILVFWLRVRRMDLTARARISCNLLFAAVCVQVALGISTLVLVVPVPLAAAHQANAVILLTMALWTAYEVGN